MKTLYTIATFLFISFLSVNSFSQGKKIIINGGVNAPVGAFSDVYKTGASAQLGFVFFSLPLVDIDLSASLEYNSFVYKNEYFVNQFRTNLGAAPSGFNPDWSANDYAIMAGARVKLPGLIFHPYAEGQVGIHIISFNQRLSGQINASSSDPSSVSLNGATESGSETGFGTEFGIGTELSIIPKFTFDVGLKYSFAAITYAKPYTVFRNNNSQYTTSELKNVSFISARAGFVLNF
jgi:hypothetical protein